MKKLRFITSALFFFVLLLGSLSASAQTGSIRGVLYEGNEKVPLAGAAVQILPSKEFRTTDLHGRFEFARLEAGRIQLVIQMLGMQTIDTTFTLARGQNLELAFNMKASSFYLEGVTVTALQSKAGQSTSSTITRVALDHLQTNSLAGILQLLPGGTTRNPSISSANYFNIRSIGGAAATSANSFGTSIVMDGAPMSTNTSRQFLSTTRTGSESNPGGGALASRGVDIRALSTDNIESAEIISGVAGVEYGDLTSGVVIIHSKAGYEPLMVRAKANPGVYEANVSQGFKLKGANEFLNPSLNFAFSPGSSNATASYSATTRVDGKLIYSNVFGNFNLNAIFSYTMMKNILLPNNDPTRSQQTRGSTMQSTRLNVRGKYRFDDLWLKSIDFTFSGDIANQYSFLGNDIAVNAGAAYTTSRAHGAVLTSLPFGTEIRDVDGNVITQYFDSDANAVIKQLPQSYREEYEIFGRPINLFGRLSATFSKQFTSNFNNRILLGLDIRHDGNTGKGIVYDPEWPPARGGSSYAAIRDRSPRDIPFMNQFGLYAEDYILWTVLNRDINITAGLRYDIIGNLSSFAPRINASLELIPKMLSVRGAYGVQTKTPLVDALYPDLAYFDLSMFSNLGVAAVRPENQYLMIGTYAYDVTNPDLKLATNEKRELGLDLKVGKWSFSATYFQEEMHNGLMFDTDLDSYQWITYNRYAMVGANAAAQAENHNKDPYTLRLSTSENLFLTYNRTTNGLHVSKRGVEFILNTGQIEAINTSFSLVGAYQHEVNWNNKEFTRNFGNQNDPLMSKYLLIRDGTLADTRQERNLVILAGDPIKQHTERFLTTLRAIHHIPRIGMMISVPIEIMWHTSTWERIQNEVNTIGQYISYKDGKLYDFTPEMYEKAIVGTQVGNPPDEFSPFFVTYKPEGFDRIYETPTAYKPYCFANVHITKEINNFIRMSFYANNLLNISPLRESNRYPGRLVRMGVAGLYIGLDLVITIR